MSCLSVSSGKEARILFFIFGSHLVPVRMFDFCIFMTTLIYFDTAVYYVTTLLGTDESDDKPF